MKITHKRSVSILLTAALFILLLAACGESSSDTAASVETEAAESTEEEIAVEEAAESTDEAETESTDEAETENSDETENRTLRVAYMTGQADQYGIIIGEELGIFEKYNVDLEATEFAYGINTIDAVQNGTADTGIVADYAAANRLGNTQEYTDLVVYAELTAKELQNGGLYVAPEYADNLDALDGSAGFIITIGTISEYFASECISWLSLDEDNQNLLAVDSTSTGLALVQQNEASAWFVYGSTVSYVEEYGWVEAIPCSELNFHIGYYLLTTESFLEENAQLIADYLLALDECIAYINDNLDECAAKFEEELGLKAEDFLENWAQYDFYIGLTVEGADHLQSIADWAYEHGSYDTAYDVRDFYNAAAAEIAFPDNSTYE